MPRVKLTIAYDGHDFHGWQRQHPPGKPPLRTVQDTVQFAVQRTIRQPVSVVGASRTDARVHAYGQVAAFSTIPPVSEEEPDELRVPLDRLPQAVNRWLPDDVAILDAAIVPDDFDPIKQAQSKTYQYTIHNCLTPPVFDRHRVLHFWQDLNVDHMAHAARYIVGTHDFASFANTHHGRDSTIRTVFACSVTRMTGQPERVIVEVSGSGFLYHMVRIISGTLVEVGRGRWEPEHVISILEARNRRAAGPTLAPEGLCLCRIEY